jgi:TonB family protein
MPDTGSTRMATRWRWSSGIRDWGLGIRDRCHPIPNPQSLIPVFLAACLTSTQTYFEAAAGQERITTGEMRTRGDALLGAECSRLMGSAQSATGVARLALTVDRQGLVTRAQLGRSTGDKRVDEIFGTLASALQFSPPTRLKGETTSVPAEAGYSCAPSASIMTFRLIQPSPVRQPGDTTTPPPTTPPPTRDDGRR